MEPGSLIPVFCHQGAVFATLGRRSLSVVALRVFCPSDEDRSVGARRLFNRTPRLQASTVMRNLRNLQVEAIFPIIWLKSLLPQFKKCHCEGASFATEAIFNMILP